MRVACIEPKILYETNPELKPRDVKILQEWLTKQPHLPKIEESQVIVFLCSCRYSIEETKRTIDNYFTRRTHHLELFQYPGREIVRKCASISLKRALPKRTPQGDVIFLFAVFNHKLENYSFINEAIVSNLIASLYIHQNGVPHSVVVVVDLKGISFGHLGKLNLSTLKQIFDHYLQKCLSIRIRSTHVINVVPFFDKIMTAAKPLLNAKSGLLDTVNIHSSLDSLHKCIPKQCLPEDYGGDLPSLQTLQDETLKEIFDNEDFFKWHDSQTVDELKRIEKSNSVEYTFGMEGTFKKLEID